MTQSLTIDRFVLGEERWTNFPGHTFQMRYLYLKAQRDTGKPPVVFIHGFMGYSFSWRFNMREFARERDVYAIDLLGMGFSDRPPKTANVPFSMEHAGRRVLQFMDSLGLKDADIVGTSHGGAVSMYMAILDRKERGGRIGRLILVAPANFYSKRGKKRIWFFDTPFGARMLKTFGGLRLIKDFGLDFMYGNPLKVTQETRDGYFKMIENPASFDYALDVIHHWWSDMRWIMANVAVIEDIPTLLVWGDRDRAVPTRTSEPVSKLFKNVKLVIMKGSGHLPYEEDPALFNREVLTWLDAAQAGTAGVRA